jgi:uncharacterized membrane protein (UPF0127 family)
MQSTKTVRNQTSPQSPSLHIKICDDFITHLAGLMFKESLLPDEGIALVYSRENKLDTSIHMFFMNFDIGVLWLDRKNRIVDSTLAKRWRPYYAPSAPASTVLEVHPKRLQDYHIHDQLLIE